MEDAAAAPAPPATPVAPKVEFSRSLPFLIKPKNLDGMIGNAEFDPFGFSEAFDVKWMREAELKHGRVSMLAVVGWLVQAQGVHLPSDTGLYDVANPIDAVFHVGAGPLLQIVLGVGALEWLNHDGKMTMTDMHEGSSRVPGEFANPIYGAKQLKGKSESVVADIKLKELKNGRLAMMAIGGLVHQTIVTGTTTFGAFPNPQLYGL
ncbi:chlorophyll a/b-binding protein domain-containing protein [Ochromonadaceae sp. CCMP2298]|nr:chlorophyll a/b-binding protein domain-containing protein [Ochromonadaceae sp. CCMP2298]